MESAYTIYLFFLQNRRYVDQIYLFNSVSFLPLIFQSLSCHTLEWSLVKIPLWQRHPVFPRYAQEFHVNYYGGIFAK